MDRPVDRDFIKFLAWPLRRAGFANLATAAENGELVDAPEDIGISPAKRLPPNYAAQPPRNYAARLMARGER